LTDSHNFKELFQGFQNTPLLWHGNEILGLEQYSPKFTTEQYALKSKQKKLRLGKWVEQFISYQLKNDQSIKVIEENIQIKDENITIGELDVLLLQNNTPMHLEIVYKFYLFDDTIVTTNPIEKWIGPNRNDALVYKLKKLKEKQLPLLYSKNTEEVLTRYNIALNAIKQCVCFKAQLFLPLTMKQVDISPLNKDCVIGRFISIKDIYDLKNFQFFIPSKLDWLSTPNPNVTWHNFNNAKIEIQQFIQNKQSPLCWIKSANNKPFKCFVTWW
jgi:uncharacterized protein